jgi:hypothetical protein
MVKQTSSEKLNEISGVLSSTISKTISSSKTEYDQTNTTYQLNENSTNCNNIKTSTTSMQYTASSDILADSTTYQSVVAQIASQITASQKQKADGGLFTEQDDDMTANIINLVQTKLDSTTMASIGNVANITETSVQVCKDAKGGNNVFFETEDDIFDYYNQAYSTSSTVQDVSADIVNTIDASQSQKSTGFLAMLMRLIAIIVIAIVAIVVVAGIIYVGTM